MVQGTRAHTEQISSIQSERRVTAGAISCAGRVALYVWRGGRLGKRATHVAAVDDRLLSPALAGFLRAEHRGEYFAGGAHGSCVARVTNRAGECSDCSTANQAGRCDQLADGAQRRSVFKLRLGDVQITGVFRFSCVCLWTLLLASLRARDRAFTLASARVTSPK